jgi:hypothetical protein
MVFRSKENVEKRWTVPPRERNNATESKRKPKVCGRIYALTALDSAKTKTAKSPIGKG